MAPAKETTTTHELLHSFGRHGGQSVAANGEALCCTIVAGSLIWHCTRLITGLELLTLQGFPTTDHMDALTNQSYAFLTDLAGNAMTGPVVSAAILSTFLFAPPLADIIDLTDTTPCEQAMANAVQMTSSLS